MGEWLIRGTAILAVACYAGRVMSELAGRNEERRARWLWALGCLAMSTHVLCAFHFQHAWSHAAAWEHTRQRTLELTGWNSGSGLYANYALTIVWLIDVLGWRTWLDWPRRYRGWYWTVQIFFAFLIVNATVVFGPKYWTPVAAGAAMFMGIACVRNCKRVA